MFQFPLKTSSGEVQAELSLDDCMRMRKILALTMLDTLTTEHLQEIFAAADVSSSIVLPEAIASLQPLMLSQQISDSGREWLLQQFTAVFQTIAGGRKAVLVPEFIAGFSVFFGGSKSEKLSNAFQAFARNLGQEDQSEPSLDRDGLCSYFCAFLGSLCSLMASSKSLKRSVIEEVSSTLADDVFASAKKTDRVNYTDVGGWYNNGGYLAAPWIELLQLKKWPGVLSDREDDVDEGQEEDDYSGSEYEEDEDDDGTNVSGWVQYYLWPVY